MGFIFALLMAYQKIEKIYYKRKDLNGMFSKKNCKSLWEIRELLRQQRIKILKAIIIYIFAKKNYKKI